MSLQNSNSKRYMHPYVQSSNVHNSQDMETTSVSTNRWWIKSVWYIYTLECGSAWKEPQHAICSNMDATGDHQDFPGGSDSKASVYNVGEPGSIPGLGRSPGEGNGNLLQHSCLENPMDRGACWATVHGGRKESDMTEWLRFRFRDDHTEWNKSIRERQIPYDITYTWNLNHGTNEPISIYETEPDSQTWRTNLWLQGSGEGEGWTEHLGL